MKKRCKTVSYVVFALRIFPEGKQVFLISTLGPLTETVTHKHWVSNLKYIKFYLWIDTKNYLG
jgi:hypothetical protein